MTQFVPVPQGPRGLSAYEIWLDAGNEGTVDDFLRSKVAANIIEFGHVGDGITVQFALPADPVAAKNVQVFVGGRRQFSPDDFAVVDMGAALSGKGIEFDVAPPDGVEIEGAVVSPSAGVSATDADLILLDGGISIASLLEGVGGISTRADLVTWWGTYAALAPAGTVVSDGAVEYLKMPAGHALFGTDPIADLPGLVPVADGRFACSVAHFAANVSPGTTDMTAGFLAARDYLAAIGGGLSAVEAGVHLVTDQSVSPSTFDDRAAVHILDDGVSFEGRGDATVKLADGGDAHVFKFGARAGSDVGATPVSGGGLRNLTIDGNRSNQTLPATGGAQNNGVDVSEGCSRIRLEGLTITNTLWYGIGFQRDGVTDCSVVDCVISGTGSDGIDAKNDNGDGTGNLIKNVTILSYGGDSGLALDVAGIDARSGWSVRNCRVFTSGTGRAKVAYRLLENADSGFNADQRSVFSGNWCSASTATGTTGFRVDAIRAVLEGNEAVGFGQGFRATQRECQLIGNRARGGTDGFILDEGSNSTDGDNAALIGNVARDNSGVGLEVKANVSNALLLGNVSRGNGTGLLVEAGATDTMAIGNDIQSNTTDVTDNGSNTTLINTGDALQTQNGAQFRRRDNPGQHLSVTHDGSNNNLTSVGKSLLVQSNGATDVKLNTEQSTRGVRLQIAGTDRFYVKNSELEATVPVQLPSYTVASLPTGQAGYRAFVTDASATTFGAVVAGGGANGTPVYHDGTDWRVG